MHQQRRAIALAGAMIAASPAHAAFVQLGGTPSPMGWVTTQPGAIEERFDGPGFPSVDTFSLPPRLPAGVRTTSGSIPNLHLSPRSNSFGYLAVGGAPLTATLNLTINGDFRYIGFDWGSIDEYNIIRFYDVANQPIFFDNFGTQISGLALAEFFEIPLYQSYFVEFSFFRSPLPRRIELVSTNNAFELDNLAFGIAAIVAPSAGEPVLPRGTGFSAGQSGGAGVPVGATPASRLPAPASQLLLALGLGALAGRALRTR